MNRETVIGIDHLSKSFDGLTVLNDINMKVFKGDTVVILGKSGTGKSVVLKCIIGLEKPDGGTVNVLGKNVPELSYNELLQLRKRVGFIFQGGALYDSMTVRQNLEFPLVRNLKLSKSEAGEHIKESLENVGLASAIDKMPSELSGGMRKRIGVARTLILKPEVMLWDEPTTGLDPETTREMSRLILKMQEKFNVTSIVVTHDISCARIVSDRIYVLSDGVFSAEGTFKKLEISEDPHVRSFFE